MLSIKFEKNTKAVSIRMTEDKTSYFTGKELVVGVGERGKRTQRKNILIARQVIEIAKQHNIKELAIDFKDFQLSGELLATSFEMANYEFNVYKTLPQDRTLVETIAMQSASKADQESFARGQIIGEAVNATRTLANTPPGLMTPSLLAEQAQIAAKGTKVNVKVLDRDDMKILKMGAILGVAQGSTEEPKFIIAEYWGDIQGRTFKKSQGPTLGSQPIVLVGKGVTFDSGGLNLKPSEHIYEMHMDMSGGAAVIHAVIAAAKLGIKRNIVALIPTVENMPSGSSYRPGDVLTSMSGQTIEILDTDAEGRGILADALSYAKRYNPQLVVDVATLTSAAEAALGQYASAIFSKDEKLIQTVQKLGEASGDYVWPLPLWDEFEEGIRGTFGDWANVGKKRRSGGAIDGAMFLYQFIRENPSSVDSGSPASRPAKWLHIDMAPRMTASEGEHLAKGAAGAPVRLLVKILESF